MSLEEDIRAAFANVQYPGDDQLTVYDPRGRKCDETFQILRGKTWPQCPVETFMRGDTPIYDLTPAAFHYYMPALLIASLDATLELDLYFSLVYAFSPSSAAPAGPIEFKQSLSPLEPTLQKEVFRILREHTSLGWEDTFSRRLSLFNASQREVICDVFREYVSRGWEDESNVREAIEALKSPGSVG